MKTLPGYQQTLPIYQQLPRHTAEVSGAATPGSLGPFPFARWGLWVPSLVCNAHAGLRVPLGQDWQLGRSLFGMPAREL